MQNLTRSTELVHADGRIEPGPELPNEISHHCSAVSDNGDIFVVGFVGDEVVTWKFQHVNNQITLVYANGPRIQGLKEKDLGCNMVYAPNHNNRQVLLVVGEAKNTNNDGLKYNSVQLLDFQLSYIFWNWIECKFGLVYFPLDLDNIFRSMLKK